MAKRKTADEKDVLIKILKKRDIFQWIIFERTEKKFNLYCVKEGVDEDFLYGEKKQNFLIIHKKFGNEIGTCQISIDFQMSEKELESKISDAEFVCNLIKNPMYVPLKRYNNYPDVKNHDSFFDEKNPQKYLTKLNQVKRDFMSGLNKYGDVRLANLEIFFTRIESKITTSLGTFMTQKRTENMIYATVLCKKGSDEREFVQMKTECRIDDLNAKEFAKEIAETVQHVLKSKKPKKYTGAVILSGDAMSEFFVPSSQDNPIILHAFARLKHINISKFKIEKPIANFKNDILTIYSNPLLDYGLRTLRYDSDVVPSQKLPILEKGIFKNYITSKMYADYLKIKPTGPLGNIEVEPGSKPEKELCSENCHEIVSFAWFNPNPFSGEFTAEIRLGYIIKNGKKTPFKGGMLTGNVFSMIENAYYSKERIKTGAYFGPKKALFYDMTIASE